MKVKVIQWVTWIILYFIGFAVFQCISDEGLKYFFGIVAGVVLVGVDNAIGRNLQWK